MPHRKTTLETLARCQGGVFYFFHRSNHSWAVVSFYTYIVTDSQNFFKIFFSMCSFALPITAIYKDIYIVESTMFFLLLCSLQELVEYEKLWYNLNIISCDSRLDYKTTKARKKKSMKRMKFWVSVLFVYV